MTYRNIVIINDKEVDIKELTEEERKCLAEFWNRIDGKCNRISGG